MFRPDLLRAKRILITGGGTGLGAAMAERLAGLGASLVLCGRASTCSNPRRHACRKRAPRRSGCSIALGAFRKFVLDHDLDIAGHDLDVAEAARLVTMIAVTSANAFRFQAVANGELRSTPNNTTRQPATERTTGRASRRRRRPVSTIL
jgi:NAD(P)-dependent dehydrogenase (short-subunit alcohol dehydrogenase family)